VVQQVAGKGTTFFANNPTASASPPRSSMRMACAEKVRFVSRGSEADLYAMRSRAPTLGATRS